jgi:hypothetical protein
MKDRLVGVNWTKNIKPTLYHRHFIEDFKEKGLHQLKEGWDFRH